MIEQRTSVNKTPEEIEAQQEREKTYKVFSKQIKAMNEMYRLPINGLPTLPLDVCDRLDKFKKTLSKEVSELDDIIKIAAGEVLTKEEEDKLQLSGHTLTLSPKEKLNLAIMIHMADLLGDVVVYCYSEALKFGIPLDDVLGKIMESNATKLGADGKPIYDENGKFLKGPNFIAPEPMIAKVLTAGIGVIQGDWK